MEETKNEQKLARIKGLLEKPTELRAERDIEELASLIKDNKFFKDRKELTQKDIKDLASMFQFAEIKQYHNVFEYGDIGELFYMIIKGSVSILIPNAEIKRWDAQRKDLLRLRSWKADEFNQKLKKAKLEA